MSGRWRRSPDWETERGFKLHQYQPERPKYRSQVTEVLLISLVTCWSLSHRLFDER